jgi:hypothetical protein
MATADALRRLALALPGTTETPHFDRRAFRVARIYVTLAAPTPAVADVGHSEHGSPEHRTSDGATANFNFTPEEQAMKLMLQPEAFAAVPGGWGRQGWTTARLDRLDEADLAAALATAHAHAVGKGRKGQRRGGAVGAPPASALEMHVNADAVAAVRDRLPLSGRNASRRRG